MAEGLLFNMIEKLIGKLGSLTVEAWNMRADLENLVENMSEIKAVVLDAEEQQKGTNNHQVKLWLEKLEGALDDADNLLDDVFTEDLRRQVMTKDKKIKKVRVFFSSSNQVLFSFKMAQKMKELRKKIEDLNVDRKIFNFTNRTPEKRVMRQRETHSFIREEEVVGRDEDKKYLIELLLDTNADVRENVSIISIIGIGGLGKTALAQLVYNDKIVQQHFELKKWVCVADDDDSDGKGFDVKGIAAKIAESKTGDEIDQVQKDLREKVNGSRYLLVLDDIWNEEREDWLHLMTLLRDGAKGSKIIITTRSEKVAKISGTSSLFFLKGLDEKQSWKLFSQLAFENGKESENPNLLSIGKEIMTKCSGVPLALCSIGSLMYSLETEKDWLNFMNKDLMKIDEQGGNTILQLIKLSYDHLPLHLKKCFSFCSLFSKDYPIEKIKLIRLWIALGFVESFDESTNLEDIGNKYFTTLVQRSFFQDLLNDFHGNTLFFKMHDLMVDLARFVSRNDYVIVNKKGQHIEKQIRHVSFGFPLDSSWHAPNSLFKACKLRTFLLPHHCNIDLRFLHVEASLEESTCNSIITSFKQFRVLNLNHINAKMIPSCIGTLIHLRYLDLSHCEQIEVLPKSITKLINLETLLLNDCFMLRELPIDLSKLINLRHLELDRCNKLICMPSGIGKLSNLQTLTKFVLDTTFNHSARASELKELNDLRDRFQIEGLECLRHCPTDAKHINILGKSHLNDLSLDWGGQIDGDNFDMIGKDDIILQSILLHPNMKALRLNGFGDLRFSSSVNSFIHLNILQLSNCPRLQSLPHLHVKRLILIKLPCLEWIVDDNSNDNSSPFCPSLIELCLFDLPSLKGWCRCNKEEIQSSCCHKLNSLHSLTISTCPSMISIPQDTNSKKISLYKITEKMFQEVTNHSKAEILEIQVIHGLKSLSAGVLQQLTTLRELRIGDCNELDLCNDEDGCYSMQWKELKNLEHLVLRSIPKMKSLPDGLQHVKTLQSIRIKDCVNLTFIPEWLTSLQTLIIKDCPKLMCIPKRSDAQKE